MVTECELCKIKDKEKYRFIGSNEHAYCVVCAWTLKEGHLIILPFRHVTSLGELNEKEAKSLLDLIDTVKTKLNKTYNDDIVIHMNTGKHATQKHIHIHLVPSKGGLREMMSKYEGVPKKEVRSVEYMEKIRNDLLREG